VLEGTLWRYRAGHRGRHRFARHALFAWDGGGSVWLYWEIPAAPLPARTLARLEERVWRRARPSQDGPREPHPVDALLVAGVQVARPGFPRAMWQRRLTRLVEHGLDPAKERGAAREVGVAGSVASARRVAGLQPAAETPRLTLREGVWAASRLLQRTAGSRRVTALLDGVPTPGHAVFRTRFAGWSSQMSTSPRNPGNPMDMALPRWRADRRADRVISEIVFDALPIDDPQVRQPDITRANQLLGWGPEIDVREGLRRRSTTTRACRR
jgi:hypothetical protein